MSTREQLRLMLDADMSSHSLVRILEQAGHDVVAAGFHAELRQLEDEPLFFFAQAERRVLITHNLRDFPRILSDWAVAGRSHHGCILSHLSTNAFGEMKRRFTRWFEQFPAPEDWIDRAVYL